MGLRTSGTVFMDETTVVARQDQTAFYGT
jgi:hypothetical protein